MVATVWTVGHSNHELDDFLLLLRAQNVTAVADVRSQPTSRRHPHFARDALRARLRQEGMAYVFLGQELGGRCDDPTLLSGDRVDFAKLAGTAPFRRGLERLRSGAARHRVAVLCAEHDPLHCHRAILVCRHLCGPDLEIQHIHGDGRLESHAGLERRLVEQQGLGGGDLFTPFETQLAEAYERQGRLIAWRPPAAGDHPA